VCSSDLKIINPLGRAVVDRDGKSVIRHIENQVLSHHGETNNTYICFTHALFPGVSSFRSTKHHSKQMPSTSVVGVDDLNFSVTDQVLR
jgi:hypothetical protein